MLRNRGTCLIKEHSDTILRQPDRFVLYAHIDSVLTILTGEDQKISCTIAYLQLFFHISFVIFSVSLCYNLVFVLVNDMLFVVVLL